MRPLEWKLKRWIAPCHISPLYISAIFVNFTFKCIPCDISITLKLISDWRELQRTAINMAGGCRAVVACLLGWEHILVSFGTLHCCNNFNSCHAGLGSQYGPGPGFLQSKKTQSVVIWLQKASLWCYIENQTHHYTIKNNNLATWWWNWWPCR